MFSSHQVSKLIQFFLLPMLFINLLVLMFSFYSLTLINILITTLILPIYLVATYFQVAKKHKNKNHLINIPVMIIIVLFAIILNYTFWGLSAGLLFNPDGETVAIVYSQTIISLGIVLVGTLLGTLYQFIRK